MRFVMVRKQPTKGVSLQIKLAVMCNAMLLIASGCATTTDLSASKASIQAATSFCSVAKPIRWADEDTDETIEQSKEHNAVGVKLKCPAFAPDKKRAR